MTTSNNGSEDGISRWEDYFYGPEHDFRAIGEITAELNSQENPPSEEERLVLEKRLSLLQNKVKGR